DLAFDRLSIAADRFLGRTLQSVGGLTETGALRDAMRRPGGILHDPNLGDLRREVRELAALLPVAEPLAAIDAGGRA
ncbi:MAG: hypothetical protein ACYC2K_05460, partial [Gemmatimonadales bacterium]